MWRSKVADGTHPSFAEAPQDGSAQKENRAVITLRVNGKTYQVDAEPTTPLLWVLRDSIGLTGTKYGCGIAQCGACTVHVDGRATRSCVLPVSAVLNSDITTIEGLSPAGQHPVQRAWIEHDVPQCGYCQSGQIMATVALLARNPNPSDSDIDREITNICRCGTYRRVRMAIHRAAELVKKG
jgi:aerobic-type carbon monoxide dehydrogenase small subunit (CoxS/CutS family)